MRLTVKALLIIILAGTSFVNVLASGYSLEERQQRNVKGFHAVEASTGIDVYISMGDKEEVTVEAKDDVINDVITEVKNGTLHLYVKNRQGFNLFNWRNYSSVKIYVTAAELNRIKASAGAEVRSETTLTGETMDMNASSGSIVKTDLVYKNLEAGASSGAQLKLSGRTKNFEVSTSSGGIINAGDLKAEYCKARASSGGNMSVFTTSEISANASSGGSIRYSGNPETKNINKSSGGLVSSR
ncbi:MAG: head GIN domain-containing protein [Bacteroidota bacterium]